jgi:Nickel responsive protein SCO4226-like
MPRYLVERLFPDGFPIASTEEGRTDCARIAAHNAALGVTWLHSYVGEDGRKSFCVCDAPSPEAVRRAAGRNGWPVEVLSQVSVLDPYFHLGSQTRRQGREK